MSCDVLQSIVNVLAIPTFVMLIWQILRNEGMQPATSIVERVEAVPKFLDVNGARFWSVEVSADASGGEYLYDAMVIPLKNTELEEDPGLIPVLDPEGTCSISARLIAPEREPIVAVFIAHRLSCVSHKSIAVATRLIVVQDRRIVVFPDRPPQPPRLCVDSEWWRWKRLAWLWRHVNQMLDFLHVPERLRFRLGRFHAVGRAYWKSMVPERDLLGPSKPPRGARRG